MIIELDFLLLLLYFFYLEEVMRQFMKKVFITFNTFNTFLTIYPKKIILEIIKLYIVFKWEKEF